MLQTNRFDDRYLSSTNLSSPLSQIHSHLTVSFRFTYILCHRSRQVLSQWGTVHLTKPAGGAGDTCSCSRPDRTGSWHVEGDTSRINHETREGTKKQKQTKQNKTNTPPKKKPNKTKQKEKTQNTLKKTNKTKKNNKQTNNNNSNKTAASHYKKSSVSSSCSSFLMFHKSLIKE